MEEVRIKHQVIGCYFTDYNDFYNTNIHKKSYVEANSKYIPILQLLKVEHDANVVFVDGVDKNNEVVTHNTANVFQARRLSPLIVNKNKINISANDLYLGPVELLLNFSRNHITTISNTGFHKTYRTIGCDLMDDYAGNIILMKIYTINLPSAITDLSGVKNYLENLIERYRNKNSPDLDEIRDVYAYAADKYADERYRESINSSSTIKVCVMHVITESVFKDNDSIYFVPYKTIITRDNITTPLDHPEIGHGNIEREQQIKLRENSIMCYIVDNKDALSDRYINVAGTIKKINKFKNMNQIDGLYVMTTDVNGKPFSDIISNLEDIDKNRYVYKSAEEANIGADVRSQYRDSVETSKTEIESLKNYYAKELLANKERYEKLLHEQGLLAKKKELEFETVRNTMKTDYEHDKYHYDRRNAEKKEEYDSEKYKRDSLVETLKTTAAVAGVLATGILLYSKLSTSK